jgi:hypothetical protein
MVQIFTLEVDPATTPRCRQSLGVIERCWPARIVVEEVLQPCLKRRIGLSRLVGLLKLLQGYIRVSGTN